MTFDASVDPVVIIGGGVVGSAVATFLAAMRPGWRVIVIERDPTYEFASSALSASSIRQQFSSPINIAISRSRAMAGSIPRASCSARSASRAKDQLGDHQGR
jgi:glycine/D-amino acid oxidase-like deaminating enzyme